MFHTSVFFYRMVVKGPSQWARVAFEHVIFKAVFGCLVWLSNLLFDVGKPKSRALQLFGIDHGRAKTMGWKTEFLYTTVAQLISEKAIANRSPWECLHTAFWNLYALVIMLISRVVFLLHMVHSTYIQHIRNPGYRFLGIEVPEPPPMLWYTYTKLQDRQTRLVVVRRDWSFRVTYHLIDMSLDLIHRYEAISYTWGNANDFEDIIIDQKAFRTTRTVADILRRRSKLIGLWPGHARGLWIDYLCINQDDIPEKNRQVPMMREIYEKAHRVMVYLGNDLDASKANWLLIKLHSLASLNSFEDLSKRYMLEKDSPSWQALGKMLSHPYFTRIWIIQELASASDIWVTYGGGLIDWELLCWAFTLFVRPEMAILLPQSDLVMRQNMPLTLENGIVIPYIKRKLHQKDTLSLNEALTISSNFNSTDPRDKVFALLGLITDDLDIHAWVDYSKSVEELYRDTTRYLLSRSSSPLHIINVAGVGYPRKVENLPSWVPDFTGLPKAGNFDVTPDYTNKYNASGSRQYDPNILLAAGLNIIRLRGVHVDEIEHLVRPYNAWPKNDSDPSEIPSWLKEIQNVTEQYSPHPYHTGQPREEAFWRTLLGDRTVEGRPAPANILEDYRAMQTVFSNTSALNSASYQASADMSIRISRFLGAAVATTRARQFGVTRRGYMGFVPPLAQEGDMVCIFAGMHTPYLVRPHYRGKGYQVAYLLVGACYFHGMMDGEMWKDGAPEVFTIC